MDLENKSVSGGSAPYAADLRRLSLYGGVLWFFDAKQGVCPALPCFDEHVYLCGLDGICDGESAVIRIPACLRLFSDADGKCEASVLWDLHAGKV